MDAFIGGAVVLSPGVPATIKVGGEFAVVLEENASTGYRWTYTATPAGLAEESAKESFRAVARADGRRPGRHRLEVYGKGRG